MEILIKLDITNEKECFGKIVDNVRKDENLTIFQQWDLIRTIKKYLSK